MCSEIRIFTLQILTNAISLYELDNVLKIYLKNASLNAKTLLPTKFQPNRMKIKVLLHFGVITARCAPFWGQKM